MGYGHAVLAVELPVIEAHTSSDHRREEFRHRSFVSKAVSRDLGIRGHVTMAPRAMADLLEEDA